MTYRLGVDVGGTFTDFTLVGANGAMALWKEDTTPDDPARGILNGLEGLASATGHGLRELLQATEIFVHGTTVATNLVIQGGGPTVGLLCTEGFRDILYFRDGHKPDRFNVHVRHPGAPVARWLRIGVPERVDRTGKVLTPLDHPTVRDAAAQFRQAGIQAVAISFLWSIVNPEHELLAADILQRELPDMFVVCSHAVLPEMREWERTSAAVLSAYVLPDVGRYLRRLEEELGERGLPQPVLIMQINGGCARVKDILRKPVNILASGPAAAPAAALSYSQLTGPDLITVDMGGTSFDVCLIRDGLPATTRALQVNNQPVGVTAVDINSVGAGGGSIAWIDDGGALRVGPRSAGAVPGPACYGSGGTDATVTDANVVLGFLPPETLLAGRRSLRRDLSHEAVARNVGGPLGVSTVEAAVGIISVVNENMASAIRATSIERGIDPRSFTLVCGGGAGPLHGTKLAQVLGIERVFIPEQAGVLCSYGLTATAVRHDYVRARRAIARSPFDLAEAVEIFRELSSSAMGELMDEGFERDEVRLERLVDARYLGELHELTISYPAETAAGDADLESLVETFHTEHEARFAYRRAELPIEVLHWRVVGIGQQPLAHVPSGDSQEQIASPKARSDAYFDGRWQDVPLYGLDDLPVGCSVQGPAIIGAPTTTIVLQPSDLLTRVGGGGFLVDVRSQVTSGVAVGS